MIFAWMFLDQGMNVDSFYIFNVLKNLNVGYTVSFSVSFFQELVGGLAIELKINFSFVLYHVITSYLRYDSYQSSRFVLDINKIINFTK